MTCRGASEPPERARADRVGNSVAANFLQITAITAKTPKPTGGKTAGLFMQLDVFEVAGLAVDAGARRRDPRGELAGFGDRLHQAGDEGIVLGRGQELLAPLLPFIV